ncbi:unnamed protein product, partial [Prorocentrum cordatum]
GGGSRIAEGGRRKRPLAWTRPASSQPPDGAVEGRAKMAGCGSGCCRVVDFGWPLDEDTPNWPTVCAVRRRVLRSPETTAFPLSRGKQAFELNGGSGTHADAPAHFIPRIPGGRTIDQLRPEELAGVPLAIVDVAAACAADHDHAVAVAELEADEEAHGPIARGSLVCVRTGFSERYRAAVDERRRVRGARAGATHAGEDDVGTGRDPWTVYHNAGRADDVHPEYCLPTMHFPGLSPAAAAWLVETRSIVGLGVDTLSPDPGASTGFGVHHAVLGADRYILENLNLDGLPARGATAVVAPLALAGAPEAPARVFAWVPAA